MIAIFVQDKLFWLRIREELELTKIELDQRINAKAIGESRG